VTVGVAVLGVPVFEHSSAVVGAISLSGITPRAGPEAREAEHWWKFATYSKGAFRFQVSWRPG